MTELLPCPFCGGEAKMTMTNHATWVACSNYHYERHQVSVHAKTEAEAIAAWNTRTIVRCRDCRHYHAEINGCDEFGDIWHDEYANVEPDGFCAWGERETNNKTGDFVTHDSGSKAVSE